MVPVVNPVSNQFLKEASTAFRAVVSCLGAPVANEIEDWIGIVKEGFEGMGPTFLIQSVPDECNSRVATRGMRVVADRLR